MSETRCACGHFCWNTRKQEWTYPNGLAKKSYEVHCYKCGTRLNADGTTTEMVAKDALRIATAFYTVEYIGHRTDAGMKFDGDAEALWANATRTAEDLADGDVPARLAEMRVRFQQAAISGGHGARPTPTIPDCYSCKRDCTDAGKPCNERSLSAEECPYKQGQSS